MYRQRAIFVVALIFSLAVAMGWKVYMRQVEGQGYGWSDWDDLTRDASGFDTKNVTFVAQRLPPAYHAALRGVGILRMPFRPDHLIPGAPLIAVSSAPDLAFPGSDIFGVVRVWGSLRALGPSGDMAPGVFPLAIDIRRIDEHPRFLPDALAPTTWRGWMAWLVGGWMFPLAANYVGRAVCRLLHVRYCAIAAVTIAATVLFVGPYLRLKSTNAPCLMVRFGARGCLASLAVCGFGVAADWRLGFPSGTPLEVGWSSASNRPLTPTLLGVGFVSNYQRNDWGDVHACALAEVDAIWLWILAAAILLVSIRALLRPAAASWLSHVQGFPIGSAGVERVGIHG
jgi:hypothetical protein